MRRELSTLPVFMAVNNNKPDQWKEDVRRSVDFYNEWFMRAAPKAFIETRVKVTAQVVDALKWTDDLNDVTPTLLKEHPEVLPILRMATAPPIARDRLIGLAGVPDSLVDTMELKSSIPPKMSAENLKAAFEKIGAIIEKLADPDIFPWLPKKEKPSDAQRERAATIVADRLCGAVTNPIIRNAQEQRQLAEIKKWLETRGYKDVTGTKGLTHAALKPGEFAFRLNVVVTQEGGDRVNIPIDTVIKPIGAKQEDLPLFIEAKSAGDFVNPNKRRKEEATKIAQLKTSYGGNVRFVLFLCGYFDTPYLGYEAAEGIDWVWEHRIEDLALFGL